MCRDVMKIDGYIVRKTKEGGGSSGGVLCVGASV